MRKNKTMRNIAIALGTFVLWGNIISLLLPVEEYGAVIKTIDFSTILFILAFLTAAFFESRAKRRDSEAENAGESRGKERYPARRETQDP